VPLLVGGRPVLLSGAHGATAREEILGVADDVFLEHGNVALRGLQVDVAEQGCADVDGQPVVDQIGGEQPAEVVWGEVQPAERWVAFA